MQSRLSARARRGRSPIFISRARAAPAPPISAQWRWRHVLVMAETMKQRENNGVLKDSGEMSSYGDCVCATLKLLAQFGEEVCWAPEPRASPFLLAVG